MSDTEDNSKPKFHELVSYEISHEISYHEEFYKTNEEIQYEKEEQEYQDISASSEIVEEFRDFCRENGLDICQNLKLQDLYDFLAQF